MQHAWTTTTVLAINAFIERNRRSFDSCGEAVTKDFQVSATRESAKILTRSEKWLKVAFLKALAIKPDLNKGMRSCKDPAFLLIQP